MTVLYETERVTVIHDDARTWLADQPKESYDLVLTDPPYGKEWQSNRRAETFDQLDNDGVDDRAGIREVITECVRLVGQNRHLYVFGPADVLAGQKVSEPTELVWDKMVNGTGDLSKPWAPAHEPITFAVSKFRHAGEAGQTCLPVRLRKGSVLRFQRPTGRKVRHPSEKPVPLLRELIESSTRAGERVLDPFGGSGSTAVAAILAGRRCIIVDSKLTWCELAISRVTLAERLADDARWV